MRDRLLAWLPPRRERDAIALRLDKWLDERRVGRASLDALAEVFKIEREGCA